MQADEIDPRFREGIDLFNSREFFDCHEILEEVWKEECDPDRQLTQGIIQIAVAYYHELRGNHVGALKLFSRGIARVKPFLPIHRGLNLQAFLGAVEVDFQNISSGGDTAKLLLPRLEES